MQAQNPIMKKIFLDTEFTGLQQNTTLISLALIAETGEEFYAEFTDYNINQLTKDTLVFLQNEVFPNLFLDKDKLPNKNQTFIHGNSGEVRSKLIEWLKSMAFDAFENPCILQVWAEVPHYDWVLFCEIFGGARLLQSQVPIHWIPIDIASCFYARDLDYFTLRNKLIEKSAISRQHNALTDAKIAKTLTEKYL